MRHPMRKRVYAGIVLGVVSLVCLLFDLGATEQPESAIDQNVSNTTTATQASDPNPEQAVQGSEQATTSTGTPTTIESQEDTAPGAPETPGAEVTAPSANSAQTNTIQITMVVDSSAASSLGYPATMASGTMELPTGASAYDALARTGLSLGGSSSYVSSINGLAEKMMGAASGWTYSVNGNTPMTAACNYVLKSGDSLCWRYVT